MLEIFGRRRTTGVLALLVGVMAMLGMAQAAQAGTLNKSGDGKQFTFTDADASSNDLDITFCLGGICGEDKFVFSDNNDSTEVPGGICDVSGTRPAGEFIFCNAAGVTNMNLSFGPGGDVLRIDQRASGPDGFGFDIGGGQRITVPLTVDGGDNGDSLTGGNGSDVIDGGAAGDFIDGGADGTNDRVDYSNRPAGQNVTVRFSDGFANEGVPGEGDFLTRIEGAIGGAGNDIFDFEGYPDAVNLDGRGGEDQLIGGNTNDTLRGGAGPDFFDGNGGATDRVSYSDHTAGVTATLLGGSNNGNSTDGATNDRDSFSSSVERIDGTDGNDVLIGSGVANTLLGGDGNDRIQGGGGDDNLSGDGGTDTVDYAYRTDTVTVSLDGVKNDGAVGDEDTIGTTFESIIGGAGGDSLKGNAGPNTIDGGGGGDPLIDGLGGQDTLLGGAGNDNIESRDGAVDNVDCGADTDTNNADGGDTRANCELPAPPAPPAPPVVNPPVVNPPIVNPPVNPVFRNMAVTVSYGYSPKFPKSTTKFFAFTAKNLPKNAKVVARCVNAKGKKCKGKLGKITTVSRTKKKTLAIKSFNKKFPAGAQLEVIVSKTGFKTQIKIVQVRKNKIPNIVTRCQTPGSSRRGSC